MPKLLKHKQMEMTRTFNVLENIVKLAFSQIVQFTKLIIKFEINYFIDNA